MGKFSIRELGPNTWPDFVRIAEKHDGVWGGCWCVAFHLNPAEAKRATRAERKALKERLVRENRSHAALVYDGEDIVGWCQFGPPSELHARMSGFSRLGATPPDWRITCFFVDRDRRKRGVATAALKGALRLIADKGGGPVDAYPTDNSRKKPTSSSFLWSGTISMFEEVGFRTLGRLGASKVVMRKSVPGR